MSNRVSYSLGRVVMTPGVAALSETSAAGDILVSLKRHANGDWGDLCNEDRALNDAALHNGTRLLSAYHVGEHKIWIITEADRSVTTLLLPEEY